MINESDYDIIEEDLMEFPSEEVVINIPTEEEFLQNDLNKTQEKII